MLGMVILHRLSSRGGDDGWNIQRTTLPTTNKNKQQTMSDWCPILYILNVSSADTNLNTTTPKAKRERLTVVMYYSSMCLPAGACGRLWYS
eukprot:scaffold62504_cov58-Cyclotella_meneghiniana.AAC.1